MAKTDKTDAPSPASGGAAKPAAASSYEPEAQYHITLTKSVAYNGTRLHPRHARVVVKGKVAEQIKDAIATAEKL